MGGTEYSCFKGIRKAETIYVCIVGLISLVLIGISVGDITYSRQALFPYVPRNVSFLFFFFFSLMSLWIFSSLSCKLIESRSHGGAHCTAAIDQLAKIVSGWKPLTCRTYLSRKKKVSLPCCVLVDAALLTLLYLCFHCWFGCYFCHNFSRRVLTIIQCIIVFERLYSICHFDSLLNRVFAAEIESSPMHSDQSRVKVIGTEPVHCMH